MSHEPVTVLLFKDNLAARTVRIPLNWFQNFGLWAGTAAAVAILSTIAAAGFYWKTLRLSPARVQDLERQVQTLETQLAAAEKAAASAPAANPLTAPSTLPAETDPTAPNPADGPVAPAVTLPNGVFFAMLPAFASDPMPAPTNIPIQVSPLQVKWEGRTLRARFSIQYSATDGGNQQGRIFVIARGPSMMAVYPSGVFQSQAAQTWLDPMKGEFFSVSRFRAVDAKLGPLDRGSVTEVYGILLSPNGKVLALQTADLRNLPAEGAKP